MGIHGGEQRGVRDAQLRRRGDLKVGKRLTAVQRVAGRRQRVTVVEIRSDSVIVDGNHPLAGMVIELEVMLVSLGSSSAASAGANHSQPQFDADGEA
jgi:FKBP-type peptidyl-prolyl cis-trans isomerase 2